MQLITTPISGAETLPPDSPEGALSGFYEAFNRRDMALMKANWAIDECVLDNPLGGIRRGWQEVAPLYERLFGGPAKVYVEFFDYSLHVAGDMFCAAGRERGFFEKGDLRIELAIRTSRVYRRIAGHWRQIHHHGSIDDPTLLGRYQAAVFG